MSDDTPTPRRLDFWLLRCAAAGLLFAAVLPLVPLGAWVVRIFDFPRLQLAGVAGVLAAYAALRCLRSDGRRESVVLAGLLGALGLWQASRVVAFTPIWTPEVREAEQADAGLSVCVANVQFDNESKQEVVETLRRQQFDLVLALEVNEEWSEAMTPLHSVYPHRLGLDLPKGHGIWLLSKQPLEGGEVRYLVSDDRPSVWATLSDESGRRVRIAGLHPTPPGLYDHEREERHDSRIRDAELMLVADEVAEDPDSHWIVMGDFNDVAWSHTTRLFQRLSGLKDPRVGRGLFNSYHSEYWLLRFPIDHVFLSPAARIGALDRRRIAGSDHFAITAEVTFPTDQRIDPEPVEDDRQDAAELVEEGLEDAQEDSGEAER